MFCCCSIHLFQFNTLVIGNDVLGSINSAATKGPRKYNPGDGSPYSARNSLYTFVQPFQEGLWKGFSHADAGHLMEVCSLIMIST